MRDTPFVVGMGQILVEGGKVDANLGGAESMIGKAADAGCNVVVFARVFGCRVDVSPCVRAGQAL